MRLVIVIVMIIMALTTAAATKKKTMMVRGRSRSNEEVGDDSVMTMMVMTRMPVTMTVVAVKVMG